MYRLAVDLHGGDSGPAVVVPASLSFLERFPDSSITFFGDTGGSDAWELLANRRLTSRLQWQHARPNSDPGLSLRALNRPAAMGDGLGKALAEHRAGRFDAVVTAADTRLLLVRAARQLQTRGRRDTLVLGAWLPSYSGHVLAVDVGARVGQSVQSLARAAELGARFLSHLRLEKPPRVGLLNIGHEVHKSETLRRPVDDALSAMPGFRYIGYVEPDDVLSGIVDLVVTDGFSGNIMLKSMSASVDFARRRVADSLNEHWYGRLATLGLGLLLRRQLASLQPREYNGAPLLGVEGWVVKSHGNADARGFERALEQTRTHLRLGLPELMRTP